MGGIRVELRTGKYDKGGNMFKKLITILASVLIILSCSSEFPKEKSYCTATHAPEWIQKDFTLDETGNFGLLDWFGWQDEGVQYHMLSMDYKDETKLLDGECDLIVIMMEGSQVDDRHGPDTPLLLGIGTIDCENWDETIKLIIDDLKSKGA